MEELKLSLRINFLFIIVLIIVLSLFGIFIYNKQKKDYLKDIDKQMFITLEDIKSIMDLSTSGKLKQIDNFNVFTDKSIISGNIKRLLEKRTYFGMIRPIVISNEGKFLIKTSMSEYLESDNDFFNKLKLSETNAFWYQSKEVNDQKKIKTYYKFLKNNQIYILINIPEAVLFAKLAEFKLFLIESIVVLILLLSFVSILLTKSISCKLRMLASSLSYMSRGEVINEISNSKRDILGRIIMSLNKVIAGLKNSTEFSKQIGMGIYTSEFSPLSSADKMGNSLLDMRKSLIKAKEDNECAKQEEQKRNWVSVGIAKFSGILQQESADLFSFSHNIIVNLVKYLDVNQGGLSLINDNDPENVFIELVSCFAYSRKKMTDKRFDLDDGLIGRCVSEKETLYMSDIPNDYINITSGLGSDNPKCLLIVPLKINEEVFGAIELASFAEIQKYQIEFVEKISQSIAFSISSTKSSLRTAELLEQSREQAEEMEAQEEELRQNIEEVIATQDQVAKREALASGFVNAVNHTMIRADFNLNGDLTYANSFFLHTFGYKSSEINKIKINALFSNDDKEDFLEKWKVIAKGGKHFDGELKLINKSGFLIPLITTFTAVREKDGSPIQILFLGLPLSK